MRIMLIWHFAPVDLKIMQQEGTSSVSQQGSGVTGSVACISVGKQKSLDYPTSFGMV